MFVAETSTKNHRDRPRLDTSTTNPGKSANYGNPVKRRIPIETSNKLQGWGGSNRHEAMEPSPIYEWGKIGLCPLHVWGPAIVHTSGCYPVIGCVRAPKPDEEWSIMIQCTNRYLAIAFLTLSLCFSCNSSELLMPSVFWKSIKSNLEWQHHTPPSEPSKEICQDCRNEWSQSVVLHKEKHERDGCQLVYKWLHLSRTLSVCWTDIQPKVLEAFVYLCCYPQTETASQIYPWGEDSSTESSIPLCRHSAVGSDANGLAWELRAAGLGRFWASQSW